MKKLNSYILGGRGDTTKGATVAIKDNLYLGVNGEWLKTAKIPADKSRTGSFSDLEVVIEKNMMQDMAKFAANKEETTDPLLQEAVKYYRLAADTEQRDKAGFKPAAAKYKTIKKITNLADFAKKAKDLVMKGFPLPFAIDVDADMKDTSTNVVYAFAPSLILPDTTYYQADNQSGQQLLKIYEKSATELLQKIGESADDAQKIVTDALAFDKSMAQYEKSSEESADYVKDYNPQEIDEFAKQGGDIDFKQIIFDATEDAPKRVIVTEPRYYKNFTKIVNADTFTNVKSWMLVQYVMSVASLLSQDLRKTAGQFSLALSGNKELQNPTKQAYHIASSAFSEVLGQYYGETYFGHEAKADVEQMVRKMISIYQKRIKQNDWLSASTKKKAIVKLDKIVLKIGYPDKVKPIYSKFKIDPKASLLENTDNMDQVIIADTFAKFKRPVDRTEWVMPGHMVNACYNPSTNDITFPAAILQAPFYSLKQSSSENFGGIGAVIAHEISHAFDNNGAQFDEYGNLHNWWTKADYAKFKKLTQAMIDEFDGLDFAGGKVNGKLVVSENVADDGGLSCALEAAKGEKDVDLKQFFINWARVWQMKSTQQLMEMFLSMDVHAPAPLRANVQAQNMDDFYPTFDVKEGDGMWLEPAKRVHIW